MARKLKKINGKVYFIETGTDSRIGETIVLEEREVSEATVQTDIDNATASRAELQTKVTQWNAMKAKIAAFKASSKTEELLP